MGYTRDYIHLLMDYTNESHVLVTLAIRLVRLFVECFDYISKYITDV